MSNLFERWEHSNPLFPLWSKYVYLEVWEKLKAEGAEITLDRDFDDRGFMEDDDYYIGVPVISFKGRLYHRFLDLIRDNFDDGEEIIKGWKEQLIEDRKRFLKEDAE